MVIAVAGGIYRYFADRFSYSSFSSQLLEDQTLFWGSVPWHYGITIILFAHVIPIFAPSLWVWLHSDPMRMLIFELIGSALGLLAIFGLLALILRRILSRRAAAVTSVMDWVLLAGLLLQVSAGAYITLFYRWGSMWYVYTAAPWLRSLFMFSPRPDLITALPWVVRFHALNAFVLIGLFPFTRLVHIFTVPVSYLWRPYQVVIWNGPGREAGAIGTGGNGGGVTRRGFFRKAVIWALSGAAGIVTAVPALRFIINAQPLSGLVWSKVGDVGPLPVDSPVSMNFEMRSTEAYMHQMVLHDVWVVRRSAGGFAVFSPICPHLGCHYKWDPEMAHFECPCHGSVFTIDGRVIAGPAPRPLDTLPYRIENGTLYVKWERFQVGIPKKVRV